MLMVIFGAGASYDSDWNRPGPAGLNRPPLADQLFEDRPNFARIVPQFPACSAIIPFLRRRDSDKTVEQVLEAYQEESKDYAARQSQLLAVRWYLRVLLALTTDAWLQESNGTSNYITLLDQIEHFGGHHQGTCIVTFNYDCLIERSLPSIGIRIQTMDDYISNNRYALFKLHGSVDWTRQLDDYPAFPTGNAIQNANYIIDHLQAVSVSRRFAISPAPNPWGLTNPGNVEYPAIAIPVERKVDFECPDEHLSALQHSIARVTKILCIGWRGTEQHFLKLLNSNLKCRPKLLAVGKDQSTASETIRNIVNADISLDNPHASQNSFSEFILKREADAFIQMG